MEIERIIGQPPAVGRFKDSQIAQQATWINVPEGKRVDAAMHTIHIVPENSSTCTYINPLDPGDECYYEYPADKGVVRPAGRM